jgi:hypothetical protein
MANDLLATRRLLGRSRAEIIALLGEPAWEEPRGTETTLNYELVAQRDFPAKCFLLPSFLFLNFEMWLLEIDCRNGRVRSAKIRRT